MSNIEGEMILAADFGGTNIKIGLVQDGSVIGRSRLDARAGQLMADRLEAVASEWELLLRKNDHSLQNCAGVGLSLPFLVDAKTQRVKGDFGKFPGASAVDFEGWSRARLGLSAVVENDLRAALLGEWVAGAAFGKKDAVMVSLGTGIGCAVVADGRLLRGANNRAAAMLGHSTVSLETPAGRCGNIGCAEDLASTATLAARAQMRSDFAGSKLARSARLDYEAVFALAAQGDACSVALLEQSLRVWAVVVQNAVLAFDPEIVVLGGAVMRGHEVILPALKQHLSQHLPAGQLPVPLVISALGDDAALLGCEALWRQTSSLFNP